MARKWDDHAGSYKKLGADITKHSLKVSKGLIADFINHYRKIEQLEDKLPAALIKARENGVSGDGLAAFKKDKGFSDAYKALDKEVDNLWAVQVKCKNIANEALATALDLKTLAEKIEKDLSEHEKDLKDAEDELKKHDAKVKAGKATVSPAMLKAIDLQRKDMAKTPKELEKLLKDIANDRKDLTEAGNLFEKMTDKKMEFYAAKFDKMIEKTLDLAPEGKDGKDDKDSGAEPDLPAALQPKPFGVAVKKAVAMGKTIEKHCTTAVDKAQKDKKLADPELKAAKTGIESLKKVHIALGKERKKSLDALRASTLAKDYERQFKEIEEAFASAVKAQRVAVAAIAKLP